MSAFIIVVISAVIGGLIGLLFYFIIQKGKTIKDPCSTCKHYNLDCNCYDKRMHDNVKEAEKEKTDYVSGQFLYCKGTFNEFEEGKSYWLEYVGNDNYIGRSDNILNNRFHITPRQLYTLLDPRHNTSEQKNVPMSYGKELEAKMYEACRRFNSQDEDAFSLSDVFYSGFEAGKELKEQKSIDINPSEFESRLNLLLKQFETLPKEELASSLNFYLNIVENDGRFNME